MQIEFHSHEQQDEFIYNLFKGKTNGTFLDISCGNPRVGSNSYTLEKFCDWSGFGFDIIDVDERDGWCNIRDAQFVQGDATSEGMTEFLKEHIPQDTVIDYISLDVDAAGTSLALQVLKRVLDAGVKFKSMPFEHEYHSHGPSLRDEQRQLLEAQGMVLLFQDVKGWTIGNSRFDNSESFEDWWINPQYFDSEILSIKNQRLYTFECVEKLRQFMKLDYQANHVCSRSFPDQYSVFWNDTDRNDWFNHIKPQVERLFEQLNIPKPA